MKPCASGVFPKLKRRLCTRRDDSLLFGYHQPRKCGISDFCAQWWRHEVIERRLLYGKARWLSSATLYQNVKRWRLHGMGCGTTAYALLVLGWRKAHFLHSGDNSKQNSKYSEGTVWRKATFPKMRQSLLSNARAFEDAYSVQFVNVRVALIVKDVMSSNYLARNSTANDIH